MTALADTLYTDLHTAFQANADPERAVGVRNYFKEPVQTLGIPVPQARALTRPIAARLKREGTPADAFDLAERMLASGNLDEGCQVETVMKPFVRQLAPSDFDRLDGWVDQCSNWAVTDSLSCHVLGELVAAHPDLATRLVPWTAAPSRWRRRAACVTLVMPVRRKVASPAKVFAVTDPLMADGDDMVQKGTGWALRDLSVQYPDEVVHYLERHPEAGRILVRYVMEKATPAVRARFIKQQR